MVDGPRYGERGVIWRCTTTGRKVWKRKLSRSEYEARIARYHAPYHRLLAERLATPRDRHGHALLVDGHSMPSVGRVGHRDEGQRRADIVPGDRHGTSCSAEVSRIVVEHCEAHGLSVARNVPYAGGWITAHYGKPDTGIEAIQIEANRAIYMEEHSCDRRPAGIERLRTVFASLLPELARAR